MHKPFNCYTTCIKHVNEQNKKKVLLQSEQLNL